ncbi:MAG: SulP family inorganic anion transporter [Burkholderiales bacterium]
MRPGPIAGWRTWLPGLAQIVSRDPWRPDVHAGVAIAIVMIPSVLAYAGLLGLPPSSGLHAAVGAMACYALLARSRRVIVGPDTTVALLAASVVLPLAGGDPTRTAVLAATLAIMTGVVLLAAARFGLGEAADVLARPVLVGYANGAALVLIESQFGALIGVSLPRDGFVQQIAAAAAALPRAHVPTLLTGLALIALMLGLRALAPRAPGPLLACAVAIAALHLFGLRELGVATLAPAPPGLPVPSLPDVGFADVRALVPGAIALAFLVFAEGVLLARTIADRHRDDVDAGNELAALGAANLGAGVLGGFNVGASGSRTITADATGATSQRAQAVALAILLAFALWFAPLLTHLPRVALAAILVVAAVHMLDVAGARALLRLDRRAFWLANAVTAGVVVLGVLPGMLIGIGLALAELLVDVARPRDAVLRRQRADGRFHDLDDDQPGGSPPGVVVYRLYAPLVFANARHVAGRIDALSLGTGPPVRLVVLDLQAVSHVDITAIEVLADLHERLEGRGIELRFARANRPLREQIERMHAGRRVGAERFFASASTAVDDFLAAEGRDRPA